MSIGQSFIIEYATTPKIALDYYYETIASANEAVATVLNSGYGKTEILAMGPGETDIIFILGNKTVKCHVVVK